MSLSAGDWVRIQRLKQAVKYDAQLDIINVVSPHSNPYNPETKISRVVGSSKTRKETSKWIDYKAARVQDFVTRTDGKQCSTCGTGSMATLNKLCGTCTSVIGTKMVIQNPRAHLRLL